MANEVIGIDIKVSLEQLKQQLATLGPGMEKEAAAMTAALAKEIKKQERAMRDAAKASASVRSESVKAAGDAAANAGTKFDKLAKAAGPLGGVLSRVSPEAGAAASSIAGLASAAEGIAGAGLVASTGAAAAGLAVLAAVVGTVYVAYKIYNADAERAAMIAEEVRSATQKLTPIFDEHEAAVRRLKVATGELSAEQLANLQIGDAAAKRLRDAIGDTSKKLGQLRVEQDSMWTQAVDGIESYAPAWTPLGAAVRAFTTNSAELGTEIESLQGVVAKAIDVTKDQTETDREAVKITDKKTAATKAYSIALAERDKAAKKAAAATAEAVAAEQKTNADAARIAMAVTKMVEKNRDVATKRQLARLEEEEEAEKRARAYITTLVQGNLDEQEKAADSAAALIQSVADESTTALDRLLGAMHQFASLAADEAAEAAEKSADRLSNIRGLLADLTTESVDASTLTGDALVRAYKRGEVGAEELTEAQRKSIATVLSEQEAAAAARTRADRKAARAAWQTQQDLNIAQTFAAGAVALIQAFAQLGPAAGAIAGIGIAAATAASIATISSQKPAFHSGGVVGGSANGQGEVSARLLPGEALLNRQATNALGSSGVAALNSGASMGAVSLRIGRLEAREIVRTDVAAGGLIVRTAKAAAASAGNTAGRTGRRPIA